MRNSDKIGLRIRSVRESRRYSQEYMAEMLSMSQSCYANLESGKTTLSIDRLLRIAEILETEITDLLELKEPSSRNGIELSQSTRQNSIPFPRETKEIYEQLIQELRNEVEFLRSLIRPF